MAGDSISPVMSAQTGTAKHARAYFASDVASRSVHGHAIERRPDGTSLVKGVQIFKAGTFRDMFGEQTTWTDVHLQQMVNHFTLLRDSKILPDVPARRDHSYTIDKVLGYFEKLYIDGEGFLTADILVTEPDQADKIARTTYRSVSAEIGMYTTNDETSYWPVVMGVAYVDIPAVEGLHSKERGAVAYYARSTDNPTQEKNVTTENDDRGARRLTSFRIKGIETTDHNAVQTYIEELEKRPAETAKFRIRGVETSDPTAVQTHIEALEAFSKETRETNRKNYVSQLATDGKIAEAMKESITEMVLAQTDEQYAAFTKAYDAAPKLSLFANHGGGGNGQAPATQDPAATGDQASEVLILEETIREHRFAGLSDEEIQNTKAFKRLSELKKS